MPVKRLRRSKPANENSLAGSRRKTLGAKEMKAANKGEPRASEIPVPRRRERLSLASKFNPTVDIKIINGLKMNFFHGDEKELFKTPMKTKRASDERQEEKVLSTPGSSSSSKYKKRKKEIITQTSSPSSNRSSPSSSPYFLRSKGPLDETLQLEKLRRSSIFNSQKDKNEKNPSYGHRKMTATDKAVANKVKTDTKDEKVINLESVGFEKLLPKAKQTKMQQMPLKQSRKSFRKLVIGSKNSPRAVRPLNAVELKISRVETVKEFVRGKKRKRDENDKIDDELWGKTAKVVIVDADFRKAAAVKRSDGSAMASDFAAISNEGNQVETVEERNEEINNKTSSHKVVEYHLCSSEMTEEVTAVNSADESASKNVPVLSTSLFAQNKIMAKDHTAKGFNQLQNDLEVVECGHSGLEYDQIKKLTSDISVRSSWSAHLYDTGKAFTPIKEKFSQIGDVTHASESSKAPDFQMNWDMSGVKNQLINSITPQRFHENSEIKKIAIGMKKSANGSDHIFLNGDASLKQGQNVIQPYFGFITSEAVSTVRTPSAKAVGLSSKPVNQSRRRLLDVGNVEGKTDTESKEARRQNVLNSKVFRSRETSLRGNGKVVPNGSNELMAKMPPSRGLSRLRKFLCVLGFPVLFIGVAYFLRLAFDRVFH